MPTNSDAPDTKDFISLGSRLSRWKLTPFAGGWVFRDFLGDFLNLWDLVGLLVSLSVLAYPPCLALAYDLAPAVAALVRSGFSWV